MISTGESHVPVGDITVWGNCSSLTMYVHIQLVLK